jgi:hypothetical protein
MTVPSPSRSAAWPNLRSLYPVYSALARESVIEMPPCGELEHALDTPSAEAVAKAERWIESMDQRIHPHQLRQYLQTSGPMHEEVVRELLLHYLGKRQHTEPDRDKVDFLMVQFFSQLAPSDLPDADLSFKTVAQLLEPVLGAVDVSEPRWLAPLSDLLSEATHARNLNWLLTTRIIERGREIKHSCGAKFFEPAALAAFTRFGFLVRRKFFRLLHQDLNAILDGLRVLESRGVATLDCRKAQFAADEPIARLRMICQSWKVMFHAEYSSGQPLCILVDLRAAVEAALMQTQKPGEVLTQPKARAAVTSTGAAAEGTPAATGNAAEFEVASTHLTWDGETTS